MPPGLNVQDSSGVAEESTPPGLQAFMPPGLLSRTPAAPPPRGSPPALPAALPARRAGLVIRRRLQDREDEDDDDLVTNPTLADLAARSDAFVAGPSVWAPGVGLGDGPEGHGDGDAGQGPEDQDGDGGTWMADGLGVAVHVTSILDQGRSAVQGMLVSLPPWARGAVLAAGLFCLVAGVSILTWLLRPGLLSRICCRRRRRTSENVTPPPGQGRPKQSIDEELQLENVTYRSWARGSLYDTNLSGDGDADGLSHGSHRDSTYSSMSDGTDTSSILSYASGMLPGGDQPDHQHHHGAGAAPSGPPGSSAAAAAAGGILAAAAVPPSAPPSCAVLLAVQFLGSEGAGSAAGRLAITVLEARGLPARDYGSSPDPAVQLSLAPRRRLLWRWPQLQMLRRGRLQVPLQPPRHLHQLRTRSRRHARHPRYDEDFAVEARRADVRDWVLQVSVVDECRLRGASELCRGEVRLRRVVDEEAPLQLTVPLAPRPEERALLLFGLSYLPTAQRLNVSVIKATRVRLQHVVPAPDHFRPYVRATLVHVGSGRRVDSARTDPQAPSTDPEFCETLSLKLTPAQLGTLSLVVALCHRLPDGDDRVPAGGRRPRDRVVGAVAIGSKVSSDRGREHWRAIEQRPRRVVSIWHTLT
ncbi:Synaptotagmin-3 [Frankliniella fusca]|uniref:Synaptotagmin-3 n=1 Tax=Frankliniella fusca TaxID=407009 RepID=A0AAE1LIT7_9NEOP|nr:Synaptotagmin-3 [Frankliniella fusca]